MIRWSMETDEEKGQVTVQGVLTVNGRDVVVEEVIATAVLLYPAQAIAGAVERIEFKLQKEQTQ